jgi:cold shock CspA family protein
MGDRDRQTGHVATWNSDRGFGWIYNDDDTGSVFAHISQIGGGFLILGQRVKFQLRVNPQKRKPEAHQVQVID